MWGPVWDSDVFSKSVTYRPTLSKFRGGLVKKKHPVDLQYMLLIHLQLRGNYYPVNVKESHKKYPFFWANIAQIGSPPPKLIWTLFLKVTCDGCHQYSLAIDDTNLVLCSTKKGVQFTTHRGPLVLICWQTHLDDD